MKHIPFPVLNPHFPIAHLWGDSQSNTFPSAVGSVFLPCLSGR